MEKEITLKNKIIIIVVLIILFILGILSIMDYYTLLPQKTYLAKDFEIKTIKSNIDYDNDGIDDYSDFLLGAKKDAENHPTYKSDYYSEGYPPENIGVCTDVVWRAFREAGYSLREMMSRDISNNIKDYIEIKIPDDNIDFRRVYNQKVFFEKYAISLTLDPYDIEEWQPGDIVFIENNHVGVVSDKRNKKGVTYLLHNSGQPVREEDYLNRKEITGHYRFDATKVPKEVLVAWDENE